MTTDRTLTRAYLRATITDELDRQDVQAVWCTHGHCTTGELIDALTNRLARLLDLPDDAPIEPTPEERLLARIFGMSLDEVTGRPKDCE